MSKSDSSSLYFFSYKTFLKVYLKEFSSSFVPGALGVAWLTFIFVELKRRPDFGVDFNLTECF